MYHRLQFQGNTLILGLAVLALVVLVAFPFTLLLITSFQDDAGFSLVNYLQAFRTGRNYTALLNTVKVGASTAGFSVLLGSPLAWLVTRTNIPGKKLLRSLFILPYMVPPFVGAISWTQLLSRRNGYINQFLMNWLGLESHVFNINTIAGLIWVMTLYLFPFVFITTAGALERMDPTLEEAAHSSGSGSFQVLKNITLPLVAPSIAGGALLVFASTIANFGIPALIGMQGRVYVLTTMIYSQMHSSGFSGIRMAAALSVLLMFVSISALLVNNLYLQRKQFTLISGKSMRPKIVDLGKWRIPLLCLSILVVLVTVIMPFTSIALTSLLKAWGLEFSLENLTLRNYRYILFEYDLTIRALRNSVILAVSAASIAMVLGSLIAYISVKTNLRGRKIIEFVSLIPYSIPGTVVAIAMILAWSGKYGVNLYNTIWILLVAYITNYIAFAVRTTSSSLQQIHSSLEEAARISGGSWTKAFRDIILPLIKPGLIAGWFLIFMPTMRELTISILLWGPRTPTIGVAIFEAQESGYLHISAALATLLLIVVLFGNWVIKKITQGNFGI